MSGSVSGCTIPGEMTCLCAFYGGGREKTISIRVHIESTVDECDIALARALWSCADRGSDNNSMYPTYVLHVLHVHRCLLVRQREISHPTPYLLTFTSKACSGNQPCNGALQREIQNTLHHLATSLIYSSRDAMYICEIRLFLRLWHCLAMRKNVALSFMILSSWCPRTDTDETGVQMPAEARESHIYVLFESTSKSIRIKLDVDPSSRSIRGWCCQMSQKRVANSVDNTVK